MPSSRSVAVSVIRSPVGLQQHVRQDRNGGLLLDHALRQTQFAYQIGLADGEFHRVLRSSYLVQPCYVLDELLKKNRIHRACGNVEVYLNYTKFNYFPLHRVAEIALRKICKTGPAPILHSFPAAAFGAVCGKHSKLYCNESIRLWISLFKSGSLLAQLLDFVDGVDHGGVVLAAERPADLRQRGVASAP